VSAPVAVLCSFRLGGTDGVSIESSKWEWALRELGFVTRRLAGELDDGLRPDDIWVPFLAIEPEPGAPVEPDVLAAAFAGVDLVVVENLCSLPLNERASSVTAEVLEQHQGRVLFHHHDLPWERPHLAHLDAFPPNRPDSLHVTINDRARVALAERGIAATTIRNAFDLHPRPGDREATRSTFEFRASDTVLVQPTRAIARKEIGKALTFVEQIAPVLPGVRYWLTGPAEDGYGPELDRLLAHASVPVTVGRARSTADVYAAADAVLFPSSREGFGNPVIESVIARRPVVVAHYPVLDELLELGFRFFSVDDPRGLAAWLEQPDEAQLAANFEIASAEFDLRDLPARIRAACTAVGWDEW
jgi:glycosyltransferase involved in cell wall biosynthesis